MTDRAPKKIWLLPGLAKKLAWAITKESEVPYIRADLVDELVEALEECADELTCWISDRYPEDNLKFPSIQKDFELDMSVVDKAKAALAKLEESHEI